MYERTPREPITPRWIMRSVIVEIIVFALGFWLGWQAAHWN